jgi:ubiquinone/menaquinone biosynthesis C-methylase UbiE
MPSMSLGEAKFCRSAPWRLVSRRVLAWAVDGVSLQGKVLEIGGGSGAMAEELVRAHPGISLITTDVDPAMVATAQRRLADQPSVKVQQADVTALPFPDESFNAVLTFLMLHHVIEWERAITEAARVLRPGGVLAGYDLTGSREAAWLHRLDRSPHRLIGPHALGPVLAKAGLEVSELRYSLGERVVRFAATRL